MTDHINVSRSEIAGADRDRAVIAEDRAHLASLLWAFRDKPEGLRAIMSNNFASIQAALLHPVVTVATTSVPQSESGWTVPQPPRWSTDMASAPKHKPIVVGKYDRGGEWHCAVAWWDNPCVAWWDNTCEWWRTGSMSVFADPTHWCDCPEPPPPVVAPHQGIRAAEAENTARSDAAYRAQFGALDALPREGSP